MKRYLLIVVLFVVIVFTIVVLINKTTFDPGKATILAALIGIVVVIVVTLFTSQSTNINRNDEFDSSTDNISNEENNKSQGTIIGKRSINELLTNESVKKILTDDECQVLIRVASGIELEPIVANTYENDIKKIIDHIREMAQVEGVNQFLFAYIYRLYAGTLLLKPPTPKLSTNNILDFALPWIEKSVEIGADFNDIDQLKESMRYIQNILEKNINSIDVSELLKREFRIIMVEASDKEVHEQVIKVMSIIVPMSKSQNVTISSKDCSAFNSGCAFGIKISQCVLPVDMREINYSKVTVSNKQLKENLLELNVAKNQVNEIVENIDSIMGNPNGIFCANKIFSQIEIIKEILNSGNDPTLFQILSIGIRIGHMLESISFISTLSNAKKPEAMEKMKSVFKKQWENISDVVFRSGLPKDISNAIEKINKDIDSSYDLDQFKNDCNDVVRYFNKDFK